PVYEGEPLLPFFHLESEVVQASLLSARAPLSGLPQVAPECYPFRYNVPRPCALYHTSLSFNTVVLIEEYSLVWSLIALRASFKIVRADLPALLTIKVCSATVALPRGRSSFSDSIP